MSLEVMAIINFIQNKIKDLEEEKGVDDPDDIWDEVKNACNLKIGVCQDILDYVKQLR